MIIASCPYCLNLYLICTKLSMINKSKDIPVARLFITPMKITPRKSKVNAKIRQMGNMINHKSMHKIWIFSLRLLFVSISLPSNEREIVVIDPVKTKGKNTIIPITPPMA